MSPTDPVAATLPSTAEHLPGDVPTLQRLVLELVVTLREQQRDNEALRHRLDLLLRRVYGRRNEGFRPDQPLLFAEADAEADAGPEAAAAAAEQTAPPATAPRRCRPHGRRRLPANLPRQTRHHELTEAQRLCPRCGQVRADIGADRSEQLDYRPASLHVVEQVVHKYVCPCCRPAPAAATAPAGPAAPESIPMSQRDAVPPSPPSAADAAGTPPSPVDAAAAGAVNAAGPGPAPAAHAVVVTAPRPPAPIAKGLPGPGLLAHLIVSKYTDHLPLHRLERVYERQGVFLPRSTLCDWLAACALLLRPLYEELVAAVLRSRALHTDDTKVKMQEPVSRQLRTARLWVYLGDAAHPYNVFDFTRTRQRDGPQQFLAGYHGYLHADAFSGYDRLYLPEAGTGAARIVEVACNAHARRKFYEARGSDALRSHQALAYYGQLYELERSAQRLDFDDGQRLKMRQELSLPILETFRRWLEAQRPEVLPKSPLGEALGYALNNWSALIRYTEAGFLAIDNNAAEREMKRIAIGRKNWLFVGSPRGGQTAAVLVSFTSTCHRLGVEPWAYLQDVLTRLPTAAAGQLADLLPDRWQAARAAESAPTPPTDPGSAAAPSLS